MKAKYIVILLVLVFSSLSIVTMPFATSQYHPQVSSMDLGVSHYTITHSVKYKVELNFSLTQKSGISQYIFKFARLDNRIPNSTFTRYTPPYQESKLLYSNLEGCKPMEVIMGHYDKFNNTYDSFNVTLSPVNTMLSELKQKVSFNQKYIIRLNSIKFGDIKDSDIGTYITGNEIFHLYCDQSEPYYERDDPLLIELSNSIVGFEDNPIEKAEKICKWVSDNINYNGNLPSQEKGALWAVNYLEGDCSEYSSLMITLLRIQGIPARKVTGFLLSNDPGTKPQVGDTWTFYESESSSNLIGHAWVEYYVPNIGWIACDPTWKYFNNIDFLRLNLNVGANFFFPPYSTVSEFLNPLFSFTIGSKFEFDYSVKVTVLESTLKPSLISPVTVLIIVLVVIILLPIILFFIFRKVKKKNSY